MVVSLERRNILDVCEIMCSINRHGCIFIGHIRFKMEVIFSTIIVTWATENFWVQSGPWAKKGLGISVIMVALKVYVDINIFEHTHIRLLYICTRKNSLVFYFFLTRISVFRFASGWLEREVKRQRLHLHVLNSNSRCKTKNNAKLQGSVKCIVYGYYI